MKRKEKNRRKWQFNQSLIIVLIIVFGFSLVAIGKLFSSYALNEVVENITFTSQKLNYIEKKPGSIEVKKSAKWIEKGKARITFDIDTVLKANNYKTDLILVLDTSNSMQGKRMDQMKKSVMNVANSLLTNSNNQVALITYGREAEIQTNLTNDLELVRDKIESIRTYEEGKRSYYHGLLRVDDILKNYEKQEDTECIILFLANGAPNKDTPNQNGEYDYLKSRYPYIEVKGIQYEVRDIQEEIIEEILEPIKRISKTQYIAEVDTLSEVLEKTILFPISYEKLEIEDIVNTEYFKSKSISNIKTSFGQGKIEEPKVIWTLDGLESGKKESLSFDIELKEEYINIEGFYATNEKESLSYQMEGVNETIESTETPVLSNYYTVEYDPNLPNGCSVSEVPESSRKIVYDTVEISEIRPNCEGYQFSGWKVVTEEAWQMNEDYFVMPQSDVILRAEWSRLSITKRMTGEVHIVYPPIMQAISYDYNKEFWKYKDKITKVVFQDNIRSLNNEQESFDVSDQKNGSVIGRIVRNEENTDSFTVYIQGEGGVIANENCANLFDSFSMVESFEGLEYFDTSNVKNMDGMFSKCTSLRNLDLSALNTSNVEIMTFMFLRDKNLTNLNLSNFDTRKVTNMKHMFRECSALENLDISYFVTDQVMDMQYMFHMCSNLKTLNLSNINTTKVTNMQYMFNECSALTTVDLNNFDTSNVTSMSHMFGKCSVLASIEVGHFDTSQVTSMDYMFEECIALTALDVSHFSTSQVKNMCAMFDKCNKLENLNLKNFNTSKVTNMNKMFRNCWALEALDLSNFDTSQVTNMVAMFQECSSLTNLDLRSFNTSQVTDMIYMFDGCSGLKSLDVSSFDTSNVTDMQVMFRNCRVLEELDLRSFNTSKVTNMFVMFRECYVVKKIYFDPTKFNTENVTNMGEMFHACTQLVDLDLSFLNTSNVTNMSDMLRSCHYLANLNISGFDTSKVTDMSGMFSSCYYGLTQLDLSEFNTSNVTNLHGMFDNCRTLINLDISNFDTSNVTNMTNMFRNCYALESLELNNFDTSKVASMVSMFSGCNSLTVLDLSHFDTSMVTEMNDMFKGMENLTDLNISNFDLQKVTNMSNMFEGCSNINTSIKINNTLINNYSNMFLNSATESGSRITVHYTRDTSSLVDLMIATKSENSNVIKGSLI